MVSEARPGPARLELPLRLGLRGGPLSSSPGRAPLPPRSEARARAWGARASGARSAHTAASPVHEPGFREPSRHRGPLSSSFSSSSSPSSDWGSSRPALVLLPVPLGSAAPVRTTAPPEREQPRSWTKSFSATPRAPTPSTSPPSAASGSCPRLAAASTVGRWPRRRWVLGRGAVSVCLSVSAAGLMRDPGERAHAALWRSPPKAGHSLYPCPCRHSLSRARSLTRSLSLPRLLSGALAISFFSLLVSKIRSDWGSAEAISPNGRPDLSGEWEAKIN